MHKISPGEKRKALLKCALEMAMLAGVTLKAAGVLPQAGSKARELQDPESHRIKNCCYGFIPLRPMPFFAPLGLLSDMPLRATWPYFHPQ